MEMSDAKRFRSSNFTHEENMALIQACSVNKYVLHSKKKSSVMLKLKREAWQRVAGAVNEVSETPREIQDIRHRWSRLCSETRTRQTRKEMAQSRCKPFTECRYMPMVADILGDDGGKTNEHGPNLEGSPSEDDFGELEHLDQKFPLPTSSASSNHQQPPARPSRSFPSFSTSSNPFLSRFRNRNSRPASPAIDELYARYLKRGILLRDMKMKNLDLQNQKLELEIQLLRQESELSHAPPANNSEDELLAAENELLAAEDELLADGQQSQPSDEVLGNSDK